MDLYGNDIIAAILPALPVAIGVLVGFPLGMLTRFLRSPADLSQRAHFAEAGMRHLQGKVREQADEIDRLRGAIAANAEAVGEVARRAIAETAT